uniref:Uncharacterized protein n=1 Tax=Arundo donax TaxID=35708 RepID=A0A0A9FAL9_ARUDO
MHHTSTMTAAAAANACAAYVNGAAFTPKEPVAISLFFFRWLRSLSATNKQLELREEEGARSEKHVAYVRYDPLSRFMRGKAERALCFAPCLFRATVSC